MFGRERGPTFGGCVPRPSLRTSIQRVERAAYAAASGPLQNVTSACPSSSWTVRMSWPSSRRCVANECRRVWDAEGGAALDTFLAPLPPPHVREPAPPTGRVTCLRTATARARFDSTHRGHVRQVAAARQQGSRESARRGEW